jgi:DNA modification methylase
MANVIELISVSDLSAYKRQLKAHSDQDVHHIAWSISEFGFNNPIVTDDANVVVAGHGRLAAALLLKLAEVPVIRLKHLTPDRVQAYRIADNVLAARVPIDREVLRVELKELLDLNLDFDIEAIGISMAEIDLVIDGKDSASKTDPDDEHPIPQAVAISQPGDLWLLGEHRLLIGDARDPNNWTQLTGGRQAAAVITDSPYNVRVSTIGSSGKTKHREFAFGSGEMSRAEYVTFLTDVHARLAEHSKQGSLLYSFIDWKHQRELIEAGENSGLDYYHLLVWNKTNAGLGSMYRSKHELIAVFKKGKAPHQNNIQLGKFGRWRANVLDYPGVNTFRRGRMEELSSHPTPKPVVMLADLMRDCTRRGDLVLDAFMGSGSTIMAAERTGRVAAGTEIDPIYGDVTVRRWQTRTGLAARHATTGLTFEETEVDRAIEGASTASAIAGG